MKIQSKVAHGSNLRSEPIDDLAVITVMRGERDLVEALSEDVSWASEWHLVDTADQATPLNLTHHNAHVHHHPLPLGSNFDQARAQAVKSCTARWALVLDTDERVSPGLVARIREQLAGLDANDVHGVWLPRLNHVLGQPMRSPNQWPDWQLRLVRTSSVVFPHEIHQKYEVGGAVERWPADEALAIQHYPFRSTAQFLDKMNIYTTIEASQRPSTPMSPMRAFASSGKYFLVRFLKQRAFKDGQEGLHFCVVSAFVRYLASAKIWEQQLERELQIPERAPRR